MEGKTPPPFAMGETTQHVCKLSLCTNGWGRKNTTISAPSDNHCKHKVFAPCACSGCQDQHQRKSELDAATTCNSNYLHHWPGVHNAAIIATCVRAFNSNSFHAPERATYCGGLSPSAVGTKAVTHVVVSPIATYATGADTRLTLGQLKLYGGGIEGKYHKHRVKMSGPLQAH